MSQLTFASIVLDYYIETHKAAFMYELAQYSRLNDKRLRKLRDAENWVGIATIWRGNREGYVPSRDALREEVLRLRALKQAVA